MNFARSTRTTQYKCVNGVRDISANATPYFVELDANGQPPRTEAERSAIRAMAQKKRAALRVRAEAAAIERDRLAQAFQEERLNSIRREAELLVANELNNVRAAADEYVMRRNLLANEDEDVRMVLPDPISE